MLHVKTQDLQVKTCDGLQLQVRTYCNSQYPKVWVVLVHGLGGDLAATEPLALDLAQNLGDAKVITYDLRGHGMSATIFPDDFSYIEQVHALDLREVCRQLCGENIILIGHSNGAVIIQEFLISKPHPKPTQVILVSAPVRLPRLLWLDRRFSYRLLKWLTKGSNNSDKRRSTDHHLNFKDTHDLSPFRVYFDLKYTHWWRLILMYMSLFGWRNRVVDQMLKSYNVVLVNGKRDRLISHHEASQFLDSNHHQICLNFSRQISKIIIDRQQV